MADMPIVPTFSAKPSPRVMTPRRWENLGSLPYLGSITIGQASSN